MVEPASIGLQTEMASGDSQTVPSGGWAVDSSDPEIAVRAEFGDAISPGQRVMYGPREMPNYVPSDQATELYPRGSQTGGQHRDVHPEKFAGKIPWKDYHRHFVVCMKLNGWNDIEAGQYLASRLQGAALKVLNNLPIDQPISFSALVDQLERRFGPGQEAENFMLELRTRRRQKDESLQQLGQAVRDLTGLAYPEMTSNVRERLAKTHFSEAIDDAEIRAAIFRAHPKTLDEAIMAALATESFLQAEKARERIRVPRHVRAVESSTQPSPGDERMKKEVEGLKSSLEEIKSMMKQMNFNGRPNQRPPVRCYNCGEPGHISHNCTKPYMGNDRRPSRRTTGRPFQQTGPQN